MNEDKMHTVLLEQRIAFLEDRDNNRLDHFLGLNKAVPATAMQGSMQNSNLHSMRRPGGIQERIRRAEAASADPALVANRNIEYNKRIEDLLRKPETEIVSDANQADEGINAIQESGT